MISKSGQTNQIVSYKNKIKYSHEWGYPFNALGTMSSDKAKNFANDVSNFSLYLYNCFWSIYIYYIIFYLHNIKFSIKDIWVTTLRSI